MEHPPADLVTVGQMDILSLSALRVSDNAILICGVRLMDFVVIGIVTEKKREFIFFWREREREF